MSTSRSASASPSPSGGEEEVPCDLNLGEIRTRVGKQLDDPDDIYWTVAEKNHAINVGQRLWCLLTLCLERTVSFALITDQTFYEISDQLSDFIVPLRVSFNGTRLKADTIHTLDALSITWRKTPGNPIRYAQLGFDLLAIYKQPASGTNMLDLIYAAEPEELVLDSDVPEIAQEQQIWLEKLATYYCLLKNGGVELKNGVMFLNEFLDAAAKYASFTRARSRAQLYDSYPVDLATVEKGRFEIKLKNQTPPKKSTESKQ